MNKIFPIVIFLVLFTNVSQASEKALVHLKLDNDKIYRSDTKSSTIKTDIYKVNSSGLREFLKSETIDLDQNNKHWLSLDNDKLELLEFDLYDTSGKYTATKEIDLRNQNSITNIDSILALSPMATAPSSPETGTVYMYQEQNNSAMCMFSAGKWLTIGGSTKCPG